jgi:hypothetical protein
MKTKKTKIEVVQFENGDIVLGNNNEETFFIQTSDGIMEYTEDEMMEVYGVIPYTMK